MKIRGKIVGFPNRRTIELEINDGIGEPHLRKFTISNPLVWLKLGDFCEFDFNESTRKIDWGKKLFKAKE